MKLLSLITAAIATLTAAAAAKVDGDVNLAILNGQNPDVIVHVRERK
jgi:hypothetical protein